MALDKVIDSVQLDSALKETAKAIRAKTGGANLIPWETDNGLKSAVETIKTEKSEQAKSVTPTKTMQEVTPDFGFALSKVIVNAIPNQYQDVSGVTAGDKDVLYGKTIVDASGNTVDGALRYRKYTGEIVERVTGSGETHVVLVSDSFLAEIRNEESLFVVIKFDTEHIPYNILQVLASNNTPVGLESAGSTVETFASVRRVHPDGGYYNYSFPPNRLNEANKGTVGATLITEDGELRVYTNSGSGYAIPVGKFSVKITW